MRGAPPIREILGISFAVALIARVGQSQTEYRHLDAGHPVRIEDAGVAALYSLDIGVLALQAERLRGGTMRYRVEPHVAYGVLPFTELEIHAPFIRIDPPRTSGARSQAGLAGLSLGAARSITIESQSIPAMAVAADVSLPVGGLAADRASWLLKALVTKTTRRVRMHINAGAGTYSIRTANGNATTVCVRPRIRLPGDTSSCLGGPPIIFDSPCSVSPTTTNAASYSVMCMPSNAVAAETTTVAPASSGKRWFGGMAVDRTLPLRSTLLVLDVFAERFVGLYPSIDWTAEVGTRWQVTPVWVMSAGIGRHFRGAVQSTSLNIGVSYELAAQPPFARP